nr:unnamed protein product [Callosobruchus analis]
MDNPAVTGTHCVIHLQVLALKILPQNLRDNLNIATKMLTVLQVKLFLDDQNKKELLQMFQDEKFQLSLAYLAGIFKFLNNLNLKLQGRNTTVLANFNHIQGLLAKLQL